MKNFLLCLVFVYASFHVCFGQEQAPEAVLIDEFPKICSEDLMARYDGFMSELQNNPSAMGYIVLYGDSSAEGRNLNFIWYLTDFYPRIRGFDKSRIQLMRGANETKMKVQFWLVPAGAEAPSPDKKFIEEEITSTTLFDKNWADFNKWSGALDIYSNGFLELGCEFSPNRAAFAKTLLEKPELKGYVVIYTEFGKSKKYAERIGKFAVNELVKAYKMPRNRLVTVYGGNRKEPEIELWFVPKNGNPPPLAPDKK